MRGPCMSVSLHICTRGAVRRVRACFPLQARLRGCWQVAIYR